MKNALILAPFAEEQLQRLRAAMQVTQEVTVNPVGDELGVGGDLHTVALDLQRRAVAEPHLVCVMADAIGQLLADTAGDRWG